MAKDPQQYRVYDAEAVFDDNVGVRLFRSLDEIRGFASKVIASDLWKSQCDVEDVKVFLGRKDSGTAKARPRYASFRGKIQDTPFIIIPPTWAASDITVLHELTHICVGLKEQHGPKFTQCYLDMIATFSSKYNARKLQDAFDREMVEYGSKTVKTDKQAQTAARKGKQKPLLSDADIAFLKMIKFF